MSEVDARCSGAARWQGECAVIGMWVGTHIGPIRAGKTDEALGLAVGFGEYRAGRADA
jgi:hypothetical protein